MRGISSYKLLLVGMFLFIVVAMTTAMVFASIPHSSSKIITACRDNSSGALRVIDTQNSSACGSSETSLNWGGEQTAVVRIGPDPNDQIIGENYDESNSRNVNSVIRFTTNAQSYSGYCIDLPFAPKFGGENSLYALNNGGNIDNVCGTSGYEAYVPFGVNSWFFSE